MMTALNNFRCQATGQTPAARLAFKWRTVLATLRARTAESGSNRGAGTTGRPTSHRRATVPSEGEAPPRIGVGRHARVGPTAAMQGPVRMAQRARRRDGSPWTAPHPQHAVPALEAGRGPVVESRLRIPPMPRSSARGGVSATERPTVDTAPVPAHSAICREQGRGAPSLTPMDTGRKPQMSSSAWPPERTDAAAAADLAIAALEAGRYDLGAALAAVAARANRASGATAVAPPAPRMAAVPYIGTTRDERPSRTDVASTQVIRSSDETAQVPVSGRCHFQPSPNHDYCWLPIWWTGDEWTHMDPYDNEAHHATPDPDTARRAAQ